MGISSHGIQMKIGDGSTPTESFSTITEVLDINGPGMELATEDGTSHDSTDGWREHIPTILSFGDTTFDIQWDPADSTHDNNSGLRNDLTSRTKRNFQIVWPDTGSTTDEFTALVVGFESGGPVEGKLTASITLRSTGKPATIN